MLSNIVKYFDLRYFSRSFTHGINLDLLNMKIFFFILYPVPEGTACGMLWTTQGRSLGSGLLTHMFFFMFFQVQLKKLKVYNKIYRFSDMIQEMFFLCF